MPMDIFFSRTTYSGLAYNPLHKQAPVSPLPADSFYKIYY